MRPRPLGLLEAGALALTLAACMAAPPGNVPPEPGPSAVLATAVPLHPSDPTRDRVGSLRYLGGWSLTARGTSIFQGLSAIEAQEDDNGWTRFTALTDGGEAFAFSATRRGDGLRIDPAYRLARLRGVDGAPLGDRPYNDAEGLSDSFDGETFTVSFEREHRLQRTADLFDHRAPVTNLPRAPFLASLADNGGIEGLAELPLSGRVVVALGAEDGRIWFCDREQTADCLPVHTRSGVPGFALTALDHLPGTSDLVALYRAYGPLSGMRTVVARISSGAAGGRAGTVEVLARLERPLTHENFEGVAAVDNGRGGWTLWMISDDGFPSGSRTLLLALDYTPGTDAPAARVPAS